MDLLEGCLPLQWIPINPSCCHGFALGYFGTSIMVATSIFIVRRLIFWFDIFRVEPDVLRRMREVIRLDRFVAGSLLSAKLAMNYLLAFCILILLRREDAQLLAVIAVVALLC